MCNVQFDYHPYDCVVNPSVLVFCLSNSWRVSALYMSEMGWLGLIGWLSLDIGVIILLYSRVANMFFSSLQSRFPVGLRANVSVI